MNISGSSATSIGTASFCQTVCGMRTATSSASTPTTA